MPREKGGGGLNYPTQIPEKGGHAADRMIGEIQRNDPILSCDARGAADVKGWNATSHIRARMAFEPHKDTAASRDKGGIRKGFLFTIRAVESTHA